MVIFVPPEPPVTNFGSFVFESTTIVGDIEETGRLPGATKLIGLGGTPKSLSKPGVLKLVIKIKLTVDKLQIIFSQISRFFLSYKT